MPARRLVASEAVGQEDSTDMSTQSLELLQHLSLPPGGFDGLAPACVRLLRPRGPDVPEASRSSDLEVLVLGLGAGGTLLAYEFAPASPAPVGGLLQCVRVWPSALEGLEPLPVRLEVNATKHDSLALAFQCNVGESQGMVLVMPLARGWAGSSRQAGSSRLLPLPYVQRLSVDDAVHQLTFMTGLSYQLKEETLLLYRVNNFTREKDGLPGVNINLNEVARPGVVAPAEPARCVDEEPAVELPGAPPDAPVAAAEEGSKTAGVSPLVRAAVCFGLLVAHVCVNMLRQRKMGNEPDWAATILLGAGSLVVFNFATEAGELPTMGLAEGDAAELKKAKEIMKREGQEDQVTDSTAKLEGKLDSIRSDKCWGITVALLNNVKSTEDGVDYQKNVYNAVSNMLSQDTVPERYCELIEKLLSVSTSGPEEVLTGLPELSNAVRGGEFAAAEETAQARQEKNERPEELSVDFFAGKGELAWPEEPAAVAEAAAPCEEDRIKSQVLLGIGLDKDAGICRFFWIGSEGLGARASSREANLHEEDVKLASGKGELGGAAIRLRDDQQLVEAEIREALNQLTSCLEISRGRLGKMFGVGAHGLKGPRRRPETGAEQRDRGVSAAVAGRAKERKPSGPIAQELAKRTEGVDALLTSPALGAFLGCRALVDDAGGPPLSGRGPPSGRGRAKTSAGKLLAE
ncbi:unnamed protein product [Prorocentrum cordatum]|uniref:Uncharacterized protein n=1 Tax=Prorocentrum cordatum TaxID=2364126 RepID=A0ABN9TQ33_9DINO|nr:unnamed protein product [Polarella glacialis]